MSSWKDFPLGTKVLEEQSLVIITFDTTGIIRIRARQRHGGCVTSFLSAEPCSRRNHMLPLNK